MRVKQRVLQSLTNRSSKLASIVLLACLGPMAGAAQPWEAELGINPNVSYSATRTMTTPMGVFVAEERQRPGMQSVAMTVAGMPSRIIIREDLGTSYALIPAMQAYREMPQQEAESQAGTDMDFSNVERLGRERVGEHDATKYRATFADEDGSGTGNVWVTDSGVMVKVEMSYDGAQGQSGSFASELSALQIGPQALSHFEVPDDYRPLDVNAMLGFLGGAAGNTAAPNAQAPTSAAPQPVAPVAVEAQASAVAADAAVAADTSEPAQPGVAGAVADGVTEAANEVVDAAADEARTGMVENTRERIREGIRGLFRRKEP